MASAWVVALALLVAAGLVGTARAQAPWPAKPQVEWPPNAAQAPWPPAPTQQQCAVEFTALRSEVERLGMAAKAGSEKRASREELCKLVTDYSVAGIKWVKYAEMNLSKCGIPDQVVNQMKAVHAKTADGQKKLCAAGSWPGGLRDNNQDYRWDGPGYRWDPPRRPEDYKYLPRFSGR